MEPSTGLSLVVVVVVAYRPVSWEGTKPRDSLPALRPINLHSNPCLHPLGTCLLREPESCSLLSFFFFARVVCGIARQKSFWENADSFTLVALQRCHTKKTDNCFCGAMFVQTISVWTEMVWTTNACLKLFSKPWKVKVTLTNLEQNYVQKHPVSRLFVYERGIIIAF